MNRTVKARLVPLLIPALLGGCVVADNPVEGIASPTPPPVPTREAATATPTPVPTTIPTATATPYPTPALEQRPLVWFVPLPPMPTSAGRPYVGSDDFMDLFSEDAPWSEAASHIQVFKFYGEWVGWNASDDQLRMAFGEVQRRGLAAAVELGPLDATADCGSGVEGFSGLSDWEIVADRVKQAGGTLHFVAFDEPYYYGHIYDGPNACHWDAERIAREVGQFIDAVHEDFPDAVIGDIEPLPGGVMTEDYVAWLETFRAVNGYDLPFLHYDLDFGRSDWLAETLEMETYAREHGIDFGMIYMGDWVSRSDEAWLSLAGERIIAYELHGGGRPDHVVFQSWHDHPDRALPEDEPYTWTGFIRRYFEDRTSIGFRTEGPGANLAFRKPVIASGALPENPPSLAVDGSAATVWIAGNFPVQWIEIDLGKPYSIASIRLVVDQTPAGETVHNVYGLGPGLGTEFVLLTTFAGSTQMLDTLEFSPSEPLRDVQHIRIETVSSPSWVAWREVEIIAAE